MPDAGALRTAADKVDVSVVVPVRNGEEFIRMALDSVHSQTARRYEVIVIDDGSVDGTPRILQEYAGRISFWSQPNRGQAAATNEGVRVAVGRYVALLDADDVCVPTRIEREVAYLDRHPEVGVVYSDRYWVDRQGQVLGTIKSQPPDTFRLLQYNYIPRSSAMVRRKCLTEVGPFDEKNSGNDDWDMWVRISERYELAYIPEPLVMYRLHGRNISLTRPRRLGYYRLTRYRMLEAACQRRGYPTWMRAMVARARLECMVGGLHPIIGEGCPRLWSRGARLLDAVERAVLRSRALGYRPPR